MLLVIPLLIYLYSADQKREYNLGFYLKHASRSMRDSSEETGTPSSD